ncbi:glycoside hydrolase family 43 protein [Planomonospora venezuelensis]|uniref:Xylan 1,4-beta-xylosidase n=1 Tax=Planomonospora venezuelensis TaxID=1999 RepID=A0A841D5E8_PLAVE|nr:glycoside hydrolase family 43 protein [Planomonospora venezuelensis]MBB5963578.1 xylan 1,4-beta-xylosidase [Planomonospora venezuelensis]GIN02097.1 xylan 1,4-beta-xylosidase [Planomonospora venezuelensis]
MPSAIARNPVLRGSHPDPSILRVGEDYYIATSTFEWCPGVRIHHSRDLVNWRCLGGALTRSEQVDLTGVPDSGGVWAPCLSYADGLFYLVYSDVESFGGFWDTPNFVVTAASPEGPWSDPVPLHARGFDPSLFHDDDGRSWLLSNRCDWRPGMPWASGIIAQEYSRAEGKLIGAPEVIFEGTEAGYTEGPHLHRRDGWYYLVTAEGGTDWEHQVTVARSRSILGPYEPDPAGAALTSRHDPALLLQKAGHASLVDTPGGDWFLAHLTGRPLTPRGRCVLGRETALQRVTWPAGGWPRVEGGVPAETVPLPLEPRPWPQEDGGWTGTEWNTLRRPASEDWMTVHDGRLRVRGGQSPWSRVRPSLVARRAASTRCSLTVPVDFSPEDFQQLAGITAYYNTQNWYLLAVTRREGVGRCLELLASDRGEITAPAGAPVGVPEAGPIRLRAGLDGSELRFSFSSGTGAWTTLPAVLDAGILSDEYATDGRSWGFTGAFLGVWAVDLTGGGAQAEFGIPSYTES